MSDWKVPFADLHLADDEAAAVTAAIERVINRAWFVLGPEVEAFERTFAEASGCRFAVGTGNGTDALALILRALGIGPGDEIITTPLSAVFTAMAIVMAGATPVFADIDPERLTLDPAAAEHAITRRTAAIMPVHLYGQPADLPAFAALSERHGLALVEDCCQAHAATCAGRPVGTYGVAGAFSFYPTKNLGALGDGGAVVTNDAALADRVRRLRNGGQQERYRHVEPGVNSRLDELQAAVLSARLPWLGRRTEQRRALARRYRRGLAAARGLHVPAECDSGHVYHLFPVMTPNRAALQARLGAAGIETLVHYPLSLPQQPAFESANAADCPKAARVAREELSLPLYPGLTDQTIDFVADTLTKDRA